MQEEKNTQIIDLSGEMKNYKKPVFQNDNAGNYYPAPNSRMIDLVIRLSGGLIKDKNQANIFLFGFVIIMIIITLFLLFDGNGQAVRSLPIPQGFDS